MTMQGIPRLEDLIAEQNSRQAFLDQVGVYFIREINDVEAERFSKSLLVIATHLKGHANQRITVYINSGGGSVGAGFAMMEMMSSPLNFPVSPRNVFSPSSWSSSR